MALCLCINGDCGSPYRRTIRGCSGVAWGAGLTVLLKSGGTTVETRTTDSAGNVYFTHFGAYTLVIAAPHPRFSAVSQSVTTTPGGTGNTVIGPASGYVCVPGCKYPIADTLNATSNWSAAAGFWLWNSGTGYYEYSATWNSAVCGLCPSSTGVVADFRWGPTSGVGPEFRYENFFNSVTNCPAHLGTKTAWLPFTTLSETCYVPSASAFDLSASYQDPSVPIICPNNTITLDLTE